MANVPAFAQQGVTSLQPNDMLSLMQARSARPLRLPVFVLLNYIKSELSKDDAWVAFVTAEIDKIEAKADEEHTHIMAEITDLETALALKADITALTAGLATKANTSALANYVLTTALTSTLANYVTSASLTTTLGTYATTSALSSGLAGKANVSHTHTIADVTGLQTALDSKMTLYVGTAAVPGGRVLQKNITLTTAGTATVYLTDNNTAGGNALFPNAIVGVQPFVNDAATLYTFSRSISADRKTLTLTVNKAATPVLSLLGLNILAAPTAAPIGTAVELLVTGY